ncbi:type II secretion system protein [Rossellomorea aquimaris]|uniref:Type II secretion system protein n=2 Tax=Bacillaceae TaxID=186817 RepID=A0A5D4U9M1_9BACI|nr:type II secretion system protein [Rossellomorea aquimaris]
MKLVLLLHYSTHSYCIINLGNLKEGGGMKLSNIFRNNQGLTLIEVLVSVTLLSTVLLVFLNFFFQAGTYTNMNQKKTVAVNVARNALMHMESQSFLEVKRKFSEVNEGTASPDDHLLNLKLCDDTRYETFGNEESPPVTCEDIPINGTSYKVTIKSKASQELDYYIPITAEVRWTANDKEFDTSVGGTVKSEDIR